MVASSGCFDHDGMMVQFLKQCWKNQQFGPDEDDQTKKIKKELGLLCFHFQKFLRPLRQKWVKSTTKHMSKNFVRAVLNRQREESGYGTDHLLASLLDVAQRRVRSGQNDRTQGLVIIYGGNIKQSNAP